MTFTKQDYILRRSELVGKLKEGAVLLLGNNLSPRNFERNYYPFRQDSHFLYYIGLDTPGLAAIIYQDGRTVLFGEKEDESEIIWSGKGTSVSDLANRCGAEDFKYYDALGKEIALLKRDTMLHYIPPFRGDNLIKMAGLLNIDGKIEENIKIGGSALLARKIVEQRAIKSTKEIAEIEKSVAVSKRMYERAFQVLEPGLRESDIAAEMQKIAIAEDLPQSFLPIVTVHGEILHNNNYKNRLGKEDLLLIDTGVEIPPSYYCSDITRTFSVARKFTERQKHIYKTVLKTQLEVIKTASPEVSNVDLHNLAARIITSGLQEAGLMKGDIDESVAAGAHALFYPHGIGHMLGIDVHDMEDLGDVVGYPDEKRRSGQFGLSFLRLVKKLRPGFVITVEPGIYFIPPLIDKWKSEKLHEDFVNYREVDNYRSFGGIRIEDDVLITDNSSRVLGPPILKHIEELEKI
ncbi:MAG: aminopeptidase P family protein [Deltaproteobacteria bacterium]|nr:aminopeptidase P family protein [Deltaproteobacteria bacterium]